MNWTSVVHNEYVHKGEPDAPRGRLWLAGAQEFLISAFERLGDWQERIGQRRRLMMMDERMLHDLGLCRDDAIAEAAKPFWKP
ncbi:MAG: DUF1127 domain-containing protein [Rhodospirillales bacterium]|jgi:uncharacterized protein YjiS (DUF1127 family)|nr:DUF1127 domain-containing protein [Rhodospirillales bacterium]